MTPAQMIAAALVSGSPALQALVLGHLAAGRPGMAALALCLPRGALAALEAAFAQAQDEAEALGALVALLIDGGREMSVSIKVEPSVGATIQDVADAMAGVANRVLVPVEAIFNGVRVVAHPNDSPADVVDDYLSSRIIAQRARHVVK